jgi:hypothetical protein
MFSKYYYLLLTYYFTTYLLLYYFTKYFNIESAFGIRAGEGCG